MKKFIAVFLILAGSLVSMLSIREYAGKNKSFDLLGYEFSLTSKEVKNIFYRNTGVGLLIFAGGIVLWTKCRKR